MAGSRRRPAVAPGFVPPDETLLKAVHLALVGEYMTVLNAVTPRAAFAPANTPPGFDMVFRAAIRLLVHQHVRKQLQAVADAYVQLSAALDVELAPQYREWLREAAVSCSQMRQSLFTVRRPSVLSIAPTLIAVVPLAVAGAGSYWSRLAESVEDLPFSSTAWAAFYLIYVLFWGAVFGAAFFTALHWKRRLLAPTPDDELARNVYASENVLFHVLGRVKRVEAPIDVYLAAGLILVVAMFLTAVSSWGRMPSILTYLLLTVASIASGLAGWFTVRALLRRRASGLV
jgi:hypothetical protein